ncbi:MAG: hypothetical protein RL011_913 [Pseudomonadota bacterium]|jgi:hypothetical protein
MRDFNDRVYQALAIYLNQGRAALASLLDAESEEFFDLMSQREAAYQNFCALDGVIQVLQLDEKSKHQARRLWQEVDIINRTLFGLMTDVQAQVSGGIRKVPQRAKVKRQWSHSLRVIRADQEG